MYKNNQAKNANAEETKPVSDRSTTDLVCEMCLAVNKWVNTRKTGLYGNRNTFLTINFERFPTLSCCNSVDVYSQQRAAEQCCCESS